MKSGRAEEKGALTVEATLSLTIFLFLFMTIYSLVNICRAQAAIQVALNNSAKQISQYTYLFGLTGFDKSLQGVYDAAKATSEETQNFVNGIGEAFEAFSQLGSDAVDLTRSSDTSIEELMNSLNTLGDDFDALKTKGGAVYNKVKEYAKEPKKLVVMFTKLFAADGLEIVKSRLLAAPICSAIVDNNLRASKDDSAEAFCKRVGIVGGYDGMDFTSSTLLTKNTNDVKIVVKYKIKALQLLPIDFTFEFVQVAQTYAWIHGDGSEAPKEGGESPSVEETTTAPGEVGAIWSAGMDLDDRNSFVRKQVLTELIESDGFSKVSGENYIQAYNKNTNTFTQVVVSNVLFGKNSLDEIDTELLKESLSKQAASIEAATSTKTKITIKNTENNKSTKETIDLETKGEKKLQIIIVIPEDSGLKEKYDQIISTLDTDVEFVIEQGYGNALGSGE